MHLRTRGKKFAAWTMAMAFGFGSATAAIYMHIPDIPGESKAAGHKDWIDVHAFNFGMSNSSGGGFVIPPAFGDFQVIKDLDIASARLGQACASGTVVPEARIESTRTINGTEVAVFEYRLRDVRVSSLNLSGGGDSVSESVTMNFARIDWIYRQLANDGSVATKVMTYWDLAQNAGGDNSPQPPAILQAAAQTVVPGESRTVELSVSDPDTEPGILDLQATTDRPDLIGDLVLGGSGTTRNLSFTASTLRSGTASVTVRVSDGTSVRSMSFAVLIAVEKTPFEAFLTAYFSSEEMLDNELVSPIADEDGDEIPTIMEYLLGTNPREFTPIGEAVIIRRTHFQERLDAFHLTLRHRTDEPNLALVLWESPDLSTWVKSSANPLYEGSPEATNVLYETLEVTIPTDVETGERFFRLGVEGSY